MREAGRIEVKVLVTDRCDHVALGGEVLSDPVRRHRHVAVAMRDDHERETTGGGDRVTHRHALDREGGRWPGRLGIHRVLVDHGLRAGRGLGRVPEFDLEVAIALRRRAGRRIEAAQVELVGLDHRQRAHADGVRARSRQFRRIDVQTVRGPGCKRRRDGDEAQRQQGAGQPSLRCSHRVLSPYGTDAERRSRNGPGRPADRYYSGGTQNAKAAAKPPD